LTQGTKNKEQTQPTLSPLAIVGVGCLFPKAGDVNEYWANIREGVDAITDIPDSHWNPEDYFDPNQKTPDMTYARRGGFIDPVDFNPLQYGMSPNNIEATDTTQLLGMVVARQALLDAGYSTGKDAGDGKEFDRDRTSVIMGVTGTLELVIPLGARLGHPIWRQALTDAGVDTDTAEDVVQRISDSYVPWQENSFPGLLGNVAAGRIANRFDLGGTNCVVDAACASSLSAIHMASLELTSGRSDMAIAGGLDTFNDIFMYMCFSKTPALSPTGNSRPFALGGDGTIIGEGMGAIILKRLDDAQQDGDQIYAVIKGIGTSSDGRGNAIYAPSAAGQTKALEDAYAQANVTPDSIELVEAHGTGTSVGDAVEAEALEKVYRKANPDDTWCAIGSVKSMIGHTKSAAGVAGMIKTVMALKHKVLPPTIKVDQPLAALEPGKAPIYINTIKRPWIASESHPRRAALSAFGFGGSNFHCVLEEAESNDAEIDWDGRVLIFALGADSKDELSNQLANIEVHQSWSEYRATAKRFCADFDAKKTHRIAFVVEKNKTDLQTLIQNAIKILSEKSSKDFWELPTGVSYATSDDDSKSNKNKTGLLFPGQGTQYVGMMRDLACQFPQFESILSSANTVEGETKHGSRLSDKIYPVPVFSDEGRQAQEDILRDTRNAQPAVGAVSLSGLRTLEAFSFKAEVAAGHSYGELVALCAAGVFDETTLHQLSLLRGKLMAEGEGDRGSMLAISAELKIVEKFIKDEKLDLVIANHNAPMQIVLSGATDQIEKATALCNEQKLRATKLPVSAAFHSKFVASAQTPFAEALSRIELHESAMSVLANTTADCYPTSNEPSGQEEIKKLLAGQLARPVKFVEQIEKMAALGVRTFVEIGPGNRLSGLVKAILGTRYDTGEFQVLALDSSSGKRHGQVDLATLLASLAVLGKEIDLSKWDENYPGSLEDRSGNNTGDKKPAMTIPLSGANYVMPREKRPASPHQPKPIFQTAVETPVLPNTSTVNTPNQQTQQITATNSQDALRTTQESILALQKMQEQTAKLHQQYLHGQETAQQTIAQLLLQQQSLMGVTTSTFTTPTPVVQAQAKAPIIQTPIQLTPEAPVASPQPIEQGMSQNKQAVEIVETEKAVHADEEVHSILLDVVAEKTGYPLEMLSLDMSLDTDLGIDSIKRVEILSALQERLPGAPTVNPEQLGTFQFLENIVEFLIAAMPKEAATKPQAMTQSTPAVSNDALNDILLQVVAEKTGYPEQMLSLEMSLDTDLGIDSIKRVEILSALQEQIPEAPMVSPEDLGKIQTLQEIVDVLGTGNTTSTSSTNPTEISTSNQDPDQSNTLNTTLLSEVLLEVVGDKTGYPMDMLNLEMSLDTDLGIDSIKRVEILSALQEKLPEAPMVSPEDLGNLQTLQQIVDFLSAGNVSSTQTNALEVVSVNDEQLSEVILDVVADKTGYPVDMLNLEMNLEVDLGIDLIKRVEILSALQERMPEIPAVKPEDLGTLQTLQKIIDHMLVSSHEIAKPETVHQEIRSKVTSEIIATVKRQILSAVALTQKQEKISLQTNATIWVTVDEPAFTQAICKSLKAKGLNPKMVPLETVPTETLAGLIILTPANPEQTFMKESFMLVQRVSQSLRGAGKSNAAILASVTRLGGQFGLNGLAMGEGDACPVSGGIAGLIKTADKEWPEVSCKAIDIQNSDNVNTLADNIVNECLLEGPLEVGLSDKGRITLELNTVELDKTIKTNTLNSKDVVVVTGGARGVTAEIALALAETYQTNLLLLGRSKQPEAEAEWLTGVGTEAEIKKAVLTKQGKGTTPKELNKACQKILADREVRNNLQRIEATGVEVIYRAVDVQDKTEVIAAIDDARKSLGTISGFVHGAGVLADKLIEDKTGEQFSHVYTTKAAGLDSLLTATGKDALKIMVMFSSSTGRFGRKGQCDYAVANEVLNKVAQQQATLRKDCRVVSVNWGPWDGGMVTPVLKKIFEREGVNVIDLKAGADYLMQEISHEGPVEVVVLGSTEERKEIKQNTSAEEIPAINMRVAFSRSLNVNDHAFLQSHVMNGHAVLPVAMITEWFAHGAMHDNLGLHYHGFRNFRVFKGVTLEADETIDLQILAGDINKENDKDIVPVELRSGKILHARAEIILAAENIQQESISNQTVSGQYSQAASEVYSSNRLFHGDILQGIADVSAFNATGITANINGATLPKIWMKKPIRSSWLTDPLALDCSFQLMILWCFEQSGVGSLPTAIGEYKQFQKNFPNEGCNININVTEHSEHSALATIEFIDQKNQLIARINNYECVIDASLEKAFTKNKLQIPSIN
jgi:acyl transferase domain-containing protein/NAD(P)-dependent dehydrogenase (short-subunit alcohol dehydrogenase family)